MNLDWQHQQVQSHRKVEARRIASNYLMHHHAVVSIIVMKTDDNHSEFESSIVVAIPIMVMTLVVAIVVTVPVIISEIPHYESPAKIVRGRAYVRLTAVTNGAMCRLSPTPLHFSARVDIRSRLFEKLQ